MQQNWRSDQAEVRIKEIGNKSVSHCFLQLQLWGTACVCACMRKRATQREYKIMLSLMRLEDIVISLMFEGPVLVCMCMFGRACFVHVLYVEYLTFTPVLTVFLLSDRDVSACVCLCVSDYNSYSELCHRILTVESSAAVPPHPTQLTPHTLLPSATFPHPLLPLSRILHDLNQPPQG